MRPQNRHLKPFLPKGEKAMTGRLYVRVSPELERIVRSIPQYPDWLRRVITDAVGREFGGLP